MSDMLEERHGQLLLFAGLLQAQLGKHSEVTGSGTFVVPSYLWDQRLIIP
jgi:hypothetical protein